MKHHVFGEKIFLARGIPVVVSLCSVLLVFAFCVYFGWITIDSIFQSGFFAAPILFGGLYLAVGLPVLCIARRLIVDIRCRAEKSD